MIKFSAKNLSCSSYLPLAILFQFLWFNSNVEIGKKSTFISSFASKNINFVSQIVELNHGIKSNQNTKLKAIDVSLDSGNRSIT